MLFFVLYSINFFFSLFFFSNYLQYDNIRGGAGRNGTDAGGKSNEEQQQRTGQEGQADGKRRVTPGLEFYGGWRRGAGEAGERVAGGSKQVT